MLSRQTVREEKSLSMTSDINMLLQTKTRPSHAGSMPPTVFQDIEVVKTIVTCRVSFYDPKLKVVLKNFQSNLQKKLPMDKHESKIQVRKVEPWNSVKVTLTIPKPAAIRLRQMALEKNEILQRLGITSVQVTGERQITVTMQNGNSHSASSAALADGKKRSNSLSGSMKDGARALHLVGVSSTSVSALRNVTESTHDKVSIKREPTKANNVDTTALLNSSAKLENLSPEVIDSVLNATSQSSSLTSSSSFSFSSRPSVLEQQHQQTTSQIVPPNVNLPASLSSTSLPVALQNTASAATAGNAVLNATPTTIKTENSTTNDLNQHPQQAVLLSPQQNGTVPTTGYCQPMFLPQAAGATGYMYGSAGPSTSSPTYGGGSLDQQHHQSQHQHQIPPPPPYRYGIQYLNAQQHSCHQQQTQQQTQSQRLIFSPPSPAQPCSPVLSDPASRNSVRNLSPLSPTGRHNVVARHAPGGFLPPVAGVYPQHPNGTLGGPLPPMSLHHSPQQQQQQQQPQHHAMSPGAYQQFAAAPPSLQDLSNPSHSSPPLSQHQPQLQRVMPSVMYQDMPSPGSVPQNAVGGSPFLANLLTNPPQPSASDEQMMPPPEAKPKRKRTRKSRPKKESPPAVSVAPLKTEITNNSDVSMLSSSAFVDVKNTGAALPGGTFQPSLTSPPSSSCSPHPNSFGQCTHINAVSSQQLDSMSPTVSRVFTGERVSVNVVKPDRHVINGGGGEGAGLSHHAQKQQPEQQQQQHPQQQQQQQHQAMIHSLENNQNPYLPPQHVLATHTTQSSVLPSFQQQQSASGQAQKAATSPPVATAPKSKRKRPKASSASSSSSSSSSANAAGPVPKSKKAARNPASTPTISPLAVQHMEETINAIAAGEGLTSPPPPPPPPPPSSTPNLSISSSTCSGSPSSSLCLTSSASTSSVDAFNVSTLPSVSYGNPSTHPVSLNGLPFAQQQQQLAAVNGSSPHADSPLHLGTINSECMSPPCGEEFDDIVALLGANVDPKLLLNEDPLLSAESPNYDSGVGSLSPNSSNNGVETNGAITMVADTNAGGSGVAGSGGVTGSTSCTSVANGISEVLDDFLASCNSLSSYCNSNTPNPLPAVSAIGGMVGDAVNSPATVLVPGSPHHGGRTNSLCGVSENLKKTPSLDRAMPANDSPLPCS